MNKRNPNARARDVRQQGTNESVRGRKIKKKSTKENCAGTQKQCKQDTCATWVIKLDKEAGIKTTIRRKQPLGGPTE